MEALYVKHKQIEEASLSLEKAVETMQTGLRLQIKGEILYINSPDAENKNITYFFVFFFICFCSVAISKVKNLSVPQ